MILVSIINNKESAQKRVLRDITNQTPLLKKSLLNTTRKGVIGTGKKEFTIKKDAIQKVANVSTKKRAPLSAKNTPNVAIKPTVKVTTAIKTREKHAIRPVPVQETEYMPPKTKEKGRI